MTEHEPRLRMKYNTVMQELFEQIRNEYIAYIWKVKGILIDASRITVIESVEVNENKIGFGVLVDKKLQYTFYP